MHLTTNLTLNPKTQQQPICSEAITAFKEELPTSISHKQLYWFNGSAELRCSLSEWRPQWTGCFSRWRRHNQTIQASVMSGKILVGVLSAFFVVYFAFETWLMRGLPHWQLKPELTSQPDLSALQLYKTIVRKQLRSCSSCVYPMKLVIFKRNTL